MSLEDILFYYTKFVYANYVEYMEIFKKYDIIKILEERVWIKIINNNL